MNSISRLWHYIRDYRGHALLNAGFNVMAVIFGVLSILVLKPFLDILFSQSSRVTVAPAAPSSLLDLDDFVLDWFNYQLSSYLGDEGAHSALGLVCIVVIVIFFFKNLFRYLAVYVMAGVRNSIERDIRKNLFSRFTTLPLAYYAEERTGDLIARMTTDVKEIEWSILRTLETFVRDPLTILASLLMMVAISAKLTLFAFGLILFIGLVIGRIGKTLKRPSAKAQKQQGTLVAIMEEMIGGLRIIKAFAAEQFLGDRFNELNDDYKTTMTKLVRRKDLASPMSEFLGISVIVVLLWFGGRLVFDGNFEASTFVTFIMLFYNIIAPAKTFSSAYYNIQKGVAAADRVDEILAIAPEITRADTGVAPIFDDVIEFKNLGFEYIEEQPVLQQINLTIKKGERIAFVGQSGAGKSTLVDLLPRFYDPTRGEISIDGINIKDIPLKQLRQMMGIVTQEAILFHDTIAANIAFGSEASQEQLEHAARIANAHDFIMETEHGYQTRIGDRGTKLSGGQRQRLTIARAVLNNPPILILDEATSALDTQAEKLVQDALNKVLQGRTSLIIAHRLSTIQDADRIIVMDGGKILESGTHEDLLNRDSAYRKFVELQDF